MTNKYIIHFLSPFFIQFLSLTGKLDFVIDEYTLTNAYTGEKIASIWFNIYGTENTTVQPVCFSDKIPFSASSVAPELFSTAMKQWKAIENICQNAQVKYDYEKLAVATFVYFFVIFHSKIDMYFLAVIPMNGYHS